MSSVELHHKIRLANSSAYGVALSICAVLFVGGVMLGSVYIPPHTIVAVLWGWLTGEFSTEIPASVVTIITTIRLPRVVMVALAGAALASSGAAYQGLFRNSLADPYIIGVAAGAGLGAILAVAFFAGAIVAWYQLPLGAFIGALAVVVIVYVLARRHTGAASNDLILAGVALGALANALTTFIMMRLGRQLSQLLGFLLGSTGSVGWDAVAILAFSVMCGMALLLVAARDLNVLLFSEEQALFLGIHVKYIRALVIFGATIMTATAVAFHGLIGFVGIIVPHSMRLVVGGDHRRLIPLSAIAGAAFLLFADIVARTIMPPQELPVGIITACCGAPFFLWQLLARRREV
ncbi:MAG: FecCD family ABC transporter permease [Roseiflexaceae bacterium]|jgi:iron complex transport system permease protein